MPYEGAVLGARAGVGEHSVPLQRVNCVTTNMDGATSQYCIARHVFGMQVVSLQYTVYEGEHGSV